MIRQNGSICNAPAGRAGRGRMLGDAGSGREVLRSCVVSRSPLVLQLDHLHQFGV